MNRREFLDILSKGAVAAGLAGCTKLQHAADEDYYALPAWGDARLLHITDTHAQLMPVYFREPNVNLGIGEAEGQLPHLVGKNLLDQLPTVGLRDPYSFTYLDFSESAALKVEMTNAQLLITIGFTHRAKGPRRSSYLDRYRIRKELSW